MPVCCVSMLLQYSGHASCCFSWFMYVFVRDVWRRQSSRRDFGVSIDRKRLRHHLKETVNGLIRPAGGKKRERILIDDNQRWIVSNEARESLAWPLLYLHNLVPFWGTIAATQNIRELVANMSMLKPPTTTTTTTITPWTDWANMAVSMTSVQDCLQCNQQPTFTACVHKQLRAASVWCIESKKKGGAKQDVYKDAKNFSCAVVAPKFLENRHSSSNRHPKVNK